MTSPLLWYLNRGTGVVLLVVFTATVVLGVLATGRSANPLWPRFVTQGLHRSLAALSVFMLAAHVISAVVDSYVDIRWWQAFVPFGGTYKPFWLALGAIALDIVAVVVATSLARSRVSPGVWYAVHLSTYAAWVSAVVHGLFIGTDSSQKWMVAITAGCVIAVSVAVFVRLAAVLWGTRPNKPRRSSGSRGSRGATATVGADSSRVGRVPVAGRGEAAQPRPVERRSARHGAPVAAGTRASGGRS